jgi:site-specific recombinase XerD
MSQRLNLRNNPTNDYLTALEHKFQKILTFHDEISIENIANELQNISQKKEDNPTLVQYLDQYLKEEIETPVRKEGTKKNYRNAFRQLKIFLRYEKIEKIKLKDFTCNEARKFKLFHEKNIEPNNKKDYMAKKIANSEVSSSTKVKNIKPLFKKAVEQGLIKVHPFHNIVLCKTSEKSPNLTMQEIKAIYDLDLSQKPELSFVKDIFLFMVYTGLSIIDTLL